MSQYSVNQAIELAVRTERDGAEFYTAIAKICSENQELAALFTRLAKDEKIHEKQFSEILKSVPDESPSSDDSDAMLLLQATSASSYFKTELLAGGSSLDIKEALLQALNFEKATLLHYVAMNDAMGGNDQIKALIKAEKGHVATLMKVLITDAQFRGLGDSF